MNPNDFDQIARAWAKRKSRRQVLLGLGSGVVAGASLLGRREHGALGQTEADPVATPELRPTFDPLLPTLDPIAIGADNYLVNGQTIFIDPEVAGNLEVVDTPIVPITIEGEIVFINVDVVAAADGTPIAVGATPEASFLEAICGLDDSQDVELYNGDLGVTIEFVAANQAAVGNLRWNSHAALKERYDDPGTVASWRWCTGTLISEDLFLTAGHCFRQDPPDFTVPRVNGTEDPIPRSEIATNMKVNFGYQLSPEGEDQLGVNFPVVELVEDQLGDLDYAIVRLDGNPGLTNGIAKVAAADTQVGNSICIIGHPLGTPKRVEAGPASQFQDDRIYYNDIDTARGSSGSGILSSPDGPIVGVHTTGGCTGARTGQNSGVRISYLLEASRCLRSLAQ